MSRIPRILAITAGLMATGALVGAICGAAALLAVLLVTDGPDVLADPSVYLFGGAVGAAIGAVGAPALGFGVLRHVPLGKAIAWTSVGAFVGGVIGWLLPIAGPLVGAVIGFGAAGIAARVATPPRARSITEGDHGVE